MSISWYPIIDYDRCCECGKCVNKCRQGVYDKSNMPKPVVYIPKAVYKGVMAVVTCALIKQFLMQAIT